VRFDSPTGGYVMGMPFQMRHAIQDSGHRPRARDADLLATDGPALTGGGARAAFEIAQEHFAALLNVLQRHRFVDRDPRTGDTGWV